MLTEAKRRHYYRLLEFVRLSRALTEMPRGTLWAVGSMEDGPFARLCWPMPDGSYLGGYVEAEGDTPSLALSAAIEKGKALAHPLAQMVRLDEELGLCDDSTNPDYVSEHLAPGVPRTDRFGRRVQTMAEKRAASVDTLPKGQDAKQGLAGTEGSAVTPKAGDAQTSPKEYP